MERAIELATVHMLQGVGGPFGAVIVRGDEVIAEGWNQVTSSKDPTAHAEVVAIRRACQALDSFELPGCVLYTSCEPCPMCLAAALWARVDGIVYGATRAQAAQAGFDDARFYAEVACDIAERELPMHQLLGEASDAPFQAWLAHEGRIEY